MKYNFIIILYFLIANSSILVAQKKYNFDSSYKENQTYTHLNIINTFLKLNFVGNIDEIKKIRRGPAFNKDTIIQSDKTKIIVETYNKTDHYLPFKMLVSEVKVNGENKFQGSLQPFFKGEFNEKGIVKIDSCNNPRELKSKYNEVFKSFYEIINTIEFPEKKISIGDSFEINYFQIIPIRWYSYTVEVISTITLKSIENNEAIFEIKELYRNEESDEDHSQIIKGTNKGEIKYSLKDKIINYYKTNGNLSAILMSKISDITIIIDGEIEIEQFTEIEYKN